jgi:hypothetical protein
LVGAAIAEVSSIAGKTMMNDAIDVAIHIHDQKAKQRAPNKIPIPKLLQPAMTDKTNNKTRNDSRSSSTHR